MRIVHAVTRGDVGGAQTAVLELATAQQRAGHVVTVMAGSPGTMLDEASARGLEVVQLDALTRSVAPGTDARALSALGDELVRRRPDVVHAHSSKAGFLTRVAARRAGIACVYTAHGWPFQAGASTRQRVISWAGEAVAARWWGHVICLTDIERDRALAARVVPPSRVHVVGNGLPDVEPQFLRRGPVGARLDIVMVARFAPPKNQAGLVEAVARVAGGAGRLRVRLVGDGPGLAAVRQQCIELGVEDRVEFLGERSDVAALLAASDVCVLWSRYEGMPISLLEGLRAGLACVANELPGARELFGADAGIVVPHDRGALAAAIESLLADPPAVDRLGAAARERFVERYRIDRVVDAVDQVYAAAISDAERRGRRRG